MHKFSFEKLIVWQDSKELVKEIYKITNDFPKSETYGLSSQLRRASISVSSNLAEGSSRKTNKDKANFSTIAYSSLIEVLNQIIIAYELDYITIQKYENIRALIEMISNKINALRKTQLNN
ncbi:four helix bundle protein [Wenyingzhuangia heitensis]|uniref:Four helix bundle protein n=1 Tax=Wenyingzhuangia heitensis TaxID=1487859 RepID=A0ABX0U6B0_9FLAO|nr:four helix bundle protein [Wenyingzhuangia heitensis]NIJ44377.1 four helix bundle protein [Wenyingzhuangia heitensis]